MSQVLINVYHRREISDAPTCTFPVSDSTSLDELSRQIYVGIRLLPSQFDLTIRARLNTAPPGSAEKYQLISINHEMIWHMVLGHATPVLNFKLLELVVESVPVVSQTNYDPYSNSVPGSSTDRPVSDSPIYCDNPPEIPVSDDLHNYFDQLNNDTGSETNSEQSDPVVGEDDMAEIEDEIRVQEVINEWQRSIPFVNRGLQHPCSAFNDNVAMPYKDEAFFGYAPRIDGLFSEGQMFESKAELKSKLSGFAMDNNLHLKPGLTNRTSYVVTCKVEGCPWRLYAKKIVTGKWTIATNPLEHNCFSIACTVDSGQMTARKIADIIKPSLNKDLEMSINACRNSVRQEYTMVQPSYNKIWRGRELAIADLFGSWEKAYELLPSLLGAIQMSNPGTKYRIEHEPSTRIGVHIFTRVAWAFGPCIQAWPYLRPVISVDAGHLSGRYKGKLFMACAYDAEQQVLPIAFGIADEETSENWGWFMQFVREDVVGPGRICVISDQHGAIRSVFDRPDLGWYEENGEAVHRLCSQHIASNVYKLCKNKRIKEIFKKFVGRMKPWRFNEGMDMIKDMSITTHKYIMWCGKRVQNLEEEPLQLHKWAQCHDGGLNRWGIMTSNGSESLNSVFRVARQLPVTAIVDRSFYKVVDWFVERGEVAQRWLQNGMQLSENILSVLEHRIKKAKEHRVIPMGFDTYEVIVHDGVVKTGEKGDMKYEVRFLEGEGGMPTCECQKPQFTGIPCNHVLAVCCLRRLNPIQYVSHYYSIENYVNTWTGGFRGFGNANNWPYDMEAPKIRPDPTKINKGRRKHKRIPNSMDDMDARIRPRSGVQCSDGSNRRRTSGATGGRRRSVSGSRPSASAMYAEELAAQGSRRSVSGSRPEAFASEAEASGSQASGRQASGRQASGSRPAGRLLNRIFRRKER